MNQLPQHFMANNNGLKSLNMMPKQSLWTTTPLPLKFESDPLPPLFPELTPFSVGSTDGRNTFAGSYEYTDMDDLDIDVVSSRHEEEEEEDSHSSAGESIAFDGTETHIHQDDISPWQPFPTPHAEKTPNALSTLKEEAEDTSLMFSFSQRQDSNSMCLSYSNMPSESVLSEHQPLPLLQPQASPLDQEARARSIL